MANIRQLDKRRKSIRNIRKITRTMELIATARFKKAMDRAAAATDYTNRITAIVRDLANSGTEVSHPLLQSRPVVNNAAMLVLTSNRGLCGGYNGSVLRTGLQRRSELASSTKSLVTDVSGKRGIAALKFRGVHIDKTYTEFDDEPSFGEVSKIADGFLNAYLAGQIDRLDVVYTQFVSISKQVSVVQTLLPLASLDAGDQQTAPQSQTRLDYEFLPSAESILEEVVPASFRVRLFKCFLDAAVSEQIARMVAMKSATENAGDMIKQLSRTYNRARQSKITGEIMEIIGGVEALN
jgi:F-type H+-transporting ATPase subunit gamma